MYVLIPHFVCFEEHTSSVLFLVYVCGSMSSIVAQQLMLTFKSLYIMLISDVYFQPDFNAYINTVYYLV